MEIQVDAKSSMSFAKRLFSFSGRSTRKEFWLTALALIGVMIVAGVLGGVLGEIAGFLTFPFVVIIIAAYVALVANMFRRMHDIGLSGFWVCYLQPFGIACLFIGYLLDADESAKGVIERIRGIGSPWLGWILAILAWFFGWFFGLVLVLLAPGKKEDNAYGPNPYAVQ